MKYLNLDNLDILLSLIHAHASEHRLFHISRRDSLENEILKKVFIKSKNLTSFLHHRLITVTGFKIKSINKTKILVEEPIMTTILL